VVERVAPDCQAHGNPVTGVNTGVEDDGIGLAVAESAVESDSDSRVGVALS
jgi:hypothetical protein